MTGPDCGEMQLLLQADVDGELTPAEAARVAAHIEGCVGCAAAQGDILALSQRVRGEATRHVAPDSLREAMRARIAVGAEILPAAVSVERRGPVVTRARRFTGPALGVGLGIAATVAVMLMQPGDSGFADQLVADHIRALQPGHLIDVVSTDQHTVKPWFDGRLDYAPPVKDFAAEGFVLTGGRLDYMAGRPIAALVYGRRKHVIDVYVWPAGGKDGGDAPSGSRSGYNFIGWREGGMVFWAVSDLNAEELAAFARFWQAGAGK